MKAVEVELSKNIAEEFGMKRMLGSSYIPIKIDDVKSVADIVLLKTTKSQLKAAIESERATT